MRELMIARYERRGWPWRDRDDGRIGAYFDSESTLGVESQAEIEENPDKNA